MIVGRADMLLQRLQGPLTEPQERSVRSILSSAEKLLANLDQLAEALDEGGPDTGLSR